MIIRLMNPSVAIDTDMRDTWGAGLAAVAVAARLSCGCVTARPAWSSDDDEALTGSEGPTVRLITTLS
jgi:hypothetical protein